MTLRPLGLAALLAIVAACGSDEANNAAATTTGTAAPTTAARTTTAAEPTSATPATTTTTALATTSTVSPTTAPWATTSTTTTTAPVARAADPELDRWVVVDLSVEGQLLADGGDAIIGPDGPWPFLPLRRDAGGTTFSWVSWSSEAAGPPPGESVTAANGLTVELIPAAFTDPYFVDEPGWIRLLDADGVELHRWPWGSFTSPFLTIDDFDGRRVLVGRYSYEPAMAPAQVVYIDLECAACAESFMSPPVGTALVGVDVPDLAELDLGPLQVCPTWSPRTEVTMPGALARVQRTAFDLLADAVVHCDLRQLPIGADWTEANDDMWTALQELVHAAPTILDDGTAVFESAEIPGVWLSIDSVYGRAEVHGL